MVARDFERARAGARRPSGGDAGESCRPAARAADRHQGFGGRRADCAPPTAARSFATTCRSGTSGSSPRCAPPGAIVVGKTNTPESGAGANTRNAVYGATGNPFDPAEIRGRLVGRLGGGAGAAGWCRSPAAPTRAAACATRPRSAASSAFARRPGLVPSEKRGIGWSQPAGAGADGAHRARSVPAALRHGVATMRGDPLATTVHGKTVRRAAGFLSAGADRLVAAARGADARFRLRADRASHRRGVRREDRPVPPRFRAAPRTPRPIAPAPTRRSRCCAR